MYSQSHVRLQMLWRICQFDLLFGSANSNYRKFKDEGFWNDFFRWLSIMTFRCVEGVWLQRSTLVGQGRRACDGLRRGLLQHKSSREIIVEMQSVWLTALCMPNWDAIRMIKVLLCKCLRVFYDNASPYFYCLRNHSRLQYHYFDAFQHFYFVDILSFLLSCIFQIFGIALKSRFDIKSMAGNIIPAIATTNAVIAGCIVMEGLKILHGRFDKCRTVSFVLVSGLSLKSLFTIIKFE